MISLSRGSRSSLIFKPIALHTQVWQLWLAFCAVVCMATATMAHAQSGDTATSRMPASGEQSTPAASQENSGPADVSAAVQPTNGFGASEIAASSSWIQSTGVVDWLGPLAPIAMSPFFGVTCLSGLAIYGPDWVAQNPILHNAGPLKSPALFWTFAALTVMTSVPRFTKVSKPFAQAIDKVETYSVILILLLIKFFPATVAMPESPVAVIQLGIFSFTADTLLAVAMVLNLIIINAVKFFFEFLIWLTPIPFIDALFEVCNKTAAATLMAVYAYSPTLATIFNLILLTVAAIILRWIGRHVRFYRTLAVDPLLSLLWPAFAKPAKAELIVFPKQKVGPFAPKSQLRLTKHPSTSSAWVLRQAAWWLPRREHVLDGVQLAQCRRGWTMHEIEFQCESTGVVVFNLSRRYGSPEFEQLLEQLAVECSEPMGEISKSVQTIGA